jgi:hypothetical protein
MLWEAILLLQQGSTMLQIIIFLCCKSYNVEWPLVPQTLAPVNKYDNNFKYLCFNNEENKWLQDITLTSFADGHLFSSLLYLTQCDVNI